MGKIIFLDIDGTIRDFDGYVPDSAVEVIRQARKNGHQVCISTGRPYCQIEERIKEIGFDGIISGSGSYVEYEGNCLSQKYFSMPLYKSICKYLMERNCVIELQTYKESCILREQVEAFQNIGERIQKKLGEQARKVVHMPQIVESEEEMDNVEKILFFSNDLSNEKLTEDWNGLLHVVPVSIPNPEKWGGEITPIGINKAEGIRSILEAGRFRESDVVAIGDSENDIEMIRLASVGIAMGNGTSRVKEEADMITDSLREDGIKNAFQKLGIV